MKVFNIIKSSPYNILQNISISIILKMFGISLSFITVPLIIDFLEPELYGVWLTLISVLSWISFFDIGLGNGLRNRLTEALSKNEIELARTYVSTAYASILLISLGIYCLSLFLIPIMNWNHILNVNTINNDKLISIVLILMMYYMINFVLSIYIQLFYSVHKASISGVGILLASIMQIAGIWALIYTDTRDFLCLVNVYGISLVLSSSIMTLYFFWQSPAIIPSIKYVDMLKAKEILELGVKFFVIQIAALIIFTTDNMIITQIIGPNAVASYNIVFKLFSIITFAHSIIVTPLWSAYTDAFINRDTVWIRKTIFKLNLLMIPTFAMVIGLIIFSKSLIKLWIGDSLVVSNNLIILMALYTLISVWNNIYSYFLNGIGEIKIQMISAIIAGLINIPLSIIFSKNLNLGSAGVVLGSILSLSIFAVIGPIQSFNILKETGNMNRC